MQQTELHLVVWKRPKITKLVIETIIRNTKLGTYTLRIWDNNKDNIGLEAARQRLLETTNSTYFVCVDNDCLPPPIQDGKDWLERMIELMQKYEDFAAISMRTPVMIGTGNIFERADETGDDIVEFPHPGGSFRIMRTGDVLAVGGWKRDKPMPGRGQEERFVCGSLRAEGWRTGFAAQIKCLHLFGNRQQTKERWGYDESMKPEDSGHSDIYHPALEQGDQLEEVIKYAGEHLGHSYFNG